MYARELALYLGVTESTTSRWLSGERQPSLTSMLGLRELLGWSIEDQADALVKDIYPDALKHRMESVYVDGSTVRGVQRAGTSGLRVRTLESEDERGQEDETPGPAPA
jgi:hypothetical protein